jgi:hypothetical protein
MIAISNPPTPEELVNAERRANHLTELYRNGTALYSDSELALKEAHEIREKVLNWYRSKAKV